MIYTIPKVKKMQIYLNTKRKSIDDIKLETGCDDIINGGLYDMSKYKPVCHLKINGSVIASDPYGYWGYAWDNDDSVPTLTSNYSGFDNYICCICAAKDGRPEPINVGNELRGKRGRTAIGFKKDGTCVILCTKDGTADAMALESVQAKMLAQGCDSALILDGGSSSQCITKKGVITGRRSYVNNYILFWEDDGKDEEIENTTKIYRVQTGAFRLKSNANRLKNELLSLGYPGFVTTADGYYKVQIGAYRVRANADRMMTVLKSLGYSCFITTAEVVLDD